MVYRLSLRSLPEGPGATRALWSIRNHLRPRRARSRLYQHRFYHWQLDGYCRVHAQCGRGIDGDTYQEIDHVGFDYRAFVLHRGTCANHPLLLCPQRHDGSLLVNSEYQPESNVATTDTQLATGIVLILFGIAKSWFTGAATGAVGLAWGALSTLAVGGAAAAASYGIVRALELAP